MNRRANAGLWAIGAALVAGIGFCEEPFRVLSPFRFGADEASVQIDQLRRMKSEFGIGEFIFTGPGQTLRRLGRADTAAYERIGRQVAEAKRALAGTGCRIGWWCEPTFVCAESDPGQRILDCDGNRSDALCPLDQKVAADYCAKMAAGLRIGHPHIVFIEDDFTLSNHGGMNAMKGCFCPLHLEAYARRVGRRYEAKEIAGFFRRPTAENAPLRKAFADLSRDSLVDFARKIRETVDAVDPKVRVCLCQSGFVDVDGDSTEAIARALAGKTRPMVRIFGAGYYNENAPSALPVEVAHAVWSAQHLPPDIELIHESDTYPHNRFYNSTLFLESEIAAAVMAGVSGSYFYGTQYLDDPLEDAGYVAMMRDNRARFGAVRALRAAMRPVGVRAVYTPAEVYMVRETSKSAASGMLPTEASFLAKLGFPMTTTDDAPAAVLFGNTCDVLSDEEMSSILSGVVLLDAEAAVKLTARGFAKMIGCRATADGNEELTFVDEVIQPAAGCSCRGKKLFHRRTKSLPVIGWAEKESLFARLEPLDGAEVWSALVGPDGETVAPAVTYFANVRGGRVGVMCRSVDDVRHASLYSPRKQELLHNLFARLSGGGLPVTAPRTPSTWLMAAEGDGELLVMVNNLAGESRDDIELRFAGKWQGGEVSLLDAQGAWTPCGTVTDGRIALPVSAAVPMKPSFLRVLTSAGGKKIGLTTGGRTW